MYGGVFPTKREAHTRCQWIDNELAAMRVPDLASLGGNREKSPTLSIAAKAWQESRVDVREATTVQHRVALSRVLPVLGTRPVNTISETDVAALVAKLDGDGYARESIRKSITALAMALDFADIKPNPARDRVKVRLPRQEPVQVEPATADHIEAIARLLPSRYRLALCALDATGCRVSELATARVRDLDEHRQGWLVRAAIAKNRRARTALLPPILWNALIATLPHREDREPESSLFGVTDAQLRTAIGRSCKATGVPHFSPHDLRHRRISLGHKQGHSWAEIGAAVGQRSLSVTADTYTSVIADYREVDYAKVLRGAADDGEDRSVLPSVLPRDLEIAV